MKPNFLIVGAAKCGTTALASILGSHPDCCMSHPKEVCFFQDTIDFKPNLNFEKGWKWYQKAFSHYCGESAVGEATPSYSDRTRSPKTARRIHEFNPEMKIIYMVRDPLQRQISAWKMQWAEGIDGAWPDRRENQWALKGFDYWMQRQREVGHWDTCCYSYQLEAYELLFSFDNICVTFLEDWQNSKEAEVRRIMCFLGIIPSQINGNERANRASERKIERPWLRQIRTFAPIQSTVQYLPSSWRKWSRENFARTKVKTPFAQISPTTKQDFIDYVSDDAHALLKKYKKDMVFWGDFNQLKSGVNS